MTDGEAKMAAQKYPHLDAAYFAYYAGRNGHKNGFSDPQLVDAYKRGARSVATEDRLNRDAEWD